MIRRASLPACARNIRAVVCGTTTLGGRKWSRIRLLKACWSSRTCICFPARNACIASSIAPTHSRANCSVSALARKKSMPVLNADSTMLPFRSHAWPPRRGWAYQGSFDRSPSAPYLRRMETSEPPSVETPRSFSDGAGPVIAASAMAPRQSVEMNICALVHFGSSRYGTGSRSQSASLSLSTTCTPRASMPYRNATLHMPSCRKPSSEPRTSPLPRPQSRWYVDTPAASRAAWSWSSIATTTCDSRFRRNMLSTQLSTCALAEMVPNATNVAGWLYSLCARRTTSTRGTEKDSGRSVCAGVGTPGNGASCSTVRA
mmetsp:Transcript_13195/g.55235  ORF Transcript_13195/g.55235 Transcript_13195/m.55235 type:complete len:316 (+) Transcript_13195:6380-7327(+)